MKVYADLCRATVPASLSHCFFVSIPAHLRLPGTGIIYLWKYCTYISIYCIHCICIYEYCTYLTSVPTRANSTVHTLSSHE